jgi:hypothetical protein
MLVLYQVFTTTVPSIMDTIHGITFTVNVGALPGFFTMTVPNFKDNP